MDEPEGSLLALADSPVGVFHTDAAGRCLFVNERWTEITGMSPAMARGDGWGRALDPEDRDRVLREWREAATQDRPFRSEYRFRRPDGETTCATRNADGRLPT